MTKGKTVILMHIGSEIGIGLGVLWTGWCYQGELLNIPNVMYVCATVTFLIFALSLKNGRISSKISS